MEMVGSTGRKARGRSHRYFSLLEGCLQAIFPSTLLSLFLSSSPLGFPQFSFYGSLSIPSYPRTVSYRPPTRYDMPCVRFFRLGLPIGDTISRSSTHPFSLSSQLRDLIICPDERGVVNYVQDQSIMERDITDPSSVSLYTFSLSSLRLSFSVTFRSLLRGKKRKKKWRMSERRALSFVCITWYWW